MWINVYHIILYVQFHNFTFSKNLLCYLSDFSLNITRYMYCNTRFSFFVHLLRFKKNLFDIFYSSRCLCNDFCIYNRVFLSAAFSLLLKNAVMLGYRRGWRLTTLYCIIFNGWLKGHKTHENIVCGKHLLSIKECMKRFQVLSKSPYFICGVNWKPQPVGISSVGALL